MLSLLILNLARLAGTPTLRVQPPIDETTPTAVVLVRFALFEGSIVGRDLGQIRSNSGAADVGDVAVLALSPVEMAEARRSASFRLLRDGARQFSERLTPFLQHGLSVRMPIPQRRIKT